MLLMLLLLLHLLLMLLRQQQTAYQYSTGFSRPQKKLLREQQPTFVLETIDCEISTYEFAAAVAAAAPAVAVAACRLIRERILRTFLLLLLHLGDVCVSGLLIGGRCCICCG